MFDLLNNISYKNDFFPSLFKTITTRTFNKNYSEDDKKKRKYIIGNGKFKTNTFDINEFSKIHINGLFDIVIRHSIQNKLSICTDSNIHKYTKIFYDKNDVLCIKTKTNKNLKLSKNIKVEINTTSLIDEISLFGMGHLEITNVLDKEYNLDMNGHYSIDIKNK